MTLDNPTIRFDHISTHQRQGSCWHRFQKGAICALFSLVGFCAALPGLAQDETSVPLEFYPSVRIVVVDILAHLSQENKQTLRDTAFDDLIKYHFSYGMYIRNHYGLWRGNKILLEDACGMLPCHPDNASHVIIERTWRALQTH